MRFCIRAAGGGTTIKLRPISLLNTYQHKSVVQLNALKMKRKIEFPPPFLRAPLEMRIKLLSVLFIIYNNNTTNYSCRRKNHKFSVTKLAAALYFCFPLLLLLGAQQNQDDTIFSLTPDSLKKRRAQPLLFNLTNKLLK